MSIPNPDSHVVSDRNIGSPSLSSAATSPNRTLIEKLDASIRNFKDLVRNMGTPSISASAATSSSAKGPPPPPKQRRLWEKPLPSASIIKQISKPPPLVPPSMPFMTHNPISISQVELPTRSESEAVEEEDLKEASKPKLKPLHWDKVRASSDREMVWDHLRSSSFKLNEEMIETLFVTKTPNPKPKQATPRSVLPSPNQDNRVLDPKKAQNIAILLRALNVTTIWFWF